MLKFQETFATPKLFHEQFPGVDLDAIRNSGEGAHVKFSWVLFFLIFFSSSSAAELCRTPTGNLIVHCRSGRRAENIAQLAELALGFRKVHVYHSYTIDD